MKMVFYVRKFKLPNKDTYGFWVDKGDEQGNKKRLRYFKSQGIDSNSVESKEFSENVDAIIECASIRGIEVIRSNWYNTSNDYVDKVKEKYNKLGYLDIQMLVNVDDGEKLTANRLEHILQKHTKYESASFIYEDYYYDSIYDYPSILADLLGIKEEVASKIAILAKHKEYIKAYKLFKNPKLGVTEKRIPSNEISYKKEIISSSYDKEGHKYYYPLRKVFSSEIGIFTRSEIEQATKFAFAMLGNARPSSHGGEREREDWEIFINQLEGKLGEIAVFRQALKFGYNPSLDFTVTSRFSWDKGDLILEKVPTNSNEADFYEKRTVQIKTSKSFSQMMLLEVKDYNIDGTYKHTEDGCDSIIYDSFVAQRLNRSWTNVIKQLKKLFYENDDDIIVELLVNVQVGYDSAYMIDREKFKEVIQRKQVLRAGEGIATKANVPKSTIIEVDNYVIPLSEMKKFH